MPKRYGSNIPALCIIVERIGPCSTREVYAACEGLPRPNVEKYCSRAVDRGWMTVDRSIKPKRYAVVPGWASLIDEYNTAGKAAATLNRQAEGAARAYQHRDTGTVARALRTQPCWVFALGAYL